MATAYLFLAKIDTNFHAQDTIHQLNRLLWSEAKYRDLPDPPSA
jgi:hypothetical protein